jgi:hypothetical protein
MTKMLGMRFQETTTGDREDFSQITSGFQSESSGFGHTGEREQNDENGGVGYKLI